MMQGYREKLPLSLGGHVIPCQCHVIESQSNFNLQVSRLIFQFYHMIGSMVSHETLKFNMTRDH